MTVAVPETRTVLNAKRRVAARQAGVAMMESLMAMTILLVLVTISFFMTRLAPGGPFSNEAMMKMPPETQAALDARYGFDRPLGVQYLNYLKGLLVQAD